MSARTDAASLFAAPKLASLREGQKTEDKDKDADSSDE